MKDTAAHPNRLRETREEAGFSQATLASAAGVSKQAISDFELGEKAPSLAVAALIARVLSDALARVVTVDGLFLAAWSSSQLDSTAAGSGAQDGESGDPRGDRSGAAAGVAHSPEELA